MSCPDLEVLLTEAAEGNGPAVEHAKGCVECGAVLEEHRQLEKDLFRVSDPFPPADFVQSVMAKVAVAPVPMSREVSTGATILGVSVALAVATIIVGDVNLGFFGVRLAGAVVQLQTALVAIA